MRSVVSIDTMVVVDGETKEEVLEAARLEFIERLQRKEAELLITENLNEDGD